MKTESVITRVILISFILLLACCICPGQDRGKPWVIHIIDGSSRGADGVKLTDVNGDKLLDITTGWEEGGITRVYVHPGNDKAKGKWPAVTIGKTGSVEDAAFVDLDSDGAEDVVSCCEGGTKRIFVHWGPKNAKEYLTGEKWKQETIPASKGKMMWMFAIPMQVDGKNGIDLVVAGKGKGAEIGWFESPATPRKLDDWKYHTISPAGWIMSLFAFDMDGDGDKDVVTTDRKGSARGCRWLENSGGNGKWNNHFVGGQKSEVMFMTIADIDQDGKKDILVSAKPGKILCFLRQDKTGKSWKTREIPYPKNTGSAKGVAVGDIDKDGKPDVVVSCEHATPPKSGVTWMSLSKTGKCVGHEISGQRGIKFDRIELIDIDGDGDLDVLTCEERDQKRGIGVFWYENPGK